MNKEQHTATPKLKVAPFAKGEVVEYIGDRQRWDENMKPLFQKGMRFEIIGTVLPYEGRGIVGVDEDDEPIVDLSKDGYSIYLLGNGQRTIIWPKDSAQWLKK